MADQNQDTSPVDNQLPDQGSTQPSEQTQGTERKRKSSKHSPDLPRGTFGNKGKAETRVLNK